MTAEPARGIRIIIGDPHRCVAQGLAAILAPLLKNVGIAHSGRELISKAAQQEADVVVADLDMPDMPGADIIRILARQKAKARFIVLSGHDEPLIIEEAMAAGAWGYVRKQSPSTELVEAIGEVMAGRRYVSPGLLAALINAPDAVHRLTPRQRDVLRRMAAGERASAIARELGISVRTVESHSQALLDLLRVHSSVALVREAVRLGLVQASVKPNLRHGRSD